MKRLLFIAAALAFSGMSHAQKKNYVTFQADIANRNGDALFIRENRVILKELKADKNGTFKDTLKVKKEGMYLIFDGVEYTQVYLKNGYNLKMKMDAKNFDQSIVYSGTGAAENNYLVKSALLEQTLDEKKLMSMSEAEFNKEMDSKKVADLKRLNSEKLDANFVALETKNIEESYTGMKQYYTQKQALKKLNNTTPPTFTLDNYKGGNTKLEDFKGKYVYIDIWATWCGPCRGEIPHLKKAEEKYHGKNIEFVSISVDNPKDVEKWKKMIKDKEMGGEQLIASQETHAQMSSFFKISSIPRFILLDPNGTIVDADAPRPSDPELTKILDSLLKS